MTGESTKKLMLPDGMVITISVPKMEARGELVETIDHSPVITPDMIKIIA
jgi:hypothetical protein